jgi:hypothetical protein
MAKSVFICNAIVFSFYAARFKNYRNSYLLLANGVATLIGIQNGVLGTAPVFYGYLFYKGELAPGILDDNYEVDEFREQLDKRRLEDREKI